MAENEQPQIYRENALKRISTPEQLDQMIQITDARGWIALLAIGVILLAGLGWAVTGLLDITVKGNGILLSRGGIATLTAPAAGLCSRLTLRTGERVRPDEVVGYIAQPEGVIDLKMAREAHARIRQKYEEALATEAREHVRLRLAANAQKREALRLALITIQGDLAQAEENVRAYEQLFKEKLVSREVLIQKRREIPAIHDKIRQNEVDARALDAEDAELLKTEDEKLKDLRQQLAEAAGQLEQAGAKLALSTRIVSHFEGRIHDVLVREGSQVTAGAPLATVEIGGEGGSRPEIVMVVPARDGIRVRPGMDARISPEFARKEEYGFVLGRVTAVGAFPVTRDRMRQILQNDQLVDTFGGNEAVFEVHVEMLTDPRTRSGYKWSSSNGYPEPLPSGAMVAVEIIVEQRRPISLLIPYLKNLLGV